MLLNSMHMRRRMAGWSAQHAQRAPSWAPSAAHMRDSGFNRLRARGGVPLTLAACAAAICGGFVMFGIKWSQHEEMYPRRPRGLPGPRVAGMAEARELETSETSGALP